MQPGPALGRAGSRPSWVVVPALDEADRIEACLAALRVAGGAVQGDVHVVVVDDGSSDATARLAEALLRSWSDRHTVIAGRAAGVGWARRVGFEHALAAAGCADALIATTDADSRVAPDWLAVLHTRLDAGHRVIAGDVHLERGVDRRVALARAERLLARHAALPADEAAAPHPHFAGSNLAFRADTLQALGPLPTPVALEDQALWERCRALGIPVLRDAAVIVRTSARTAGRAPGGLADALKRDAQRFAEASTVQT